MAASFFGAIVFAVFAAAGFAAGSVVFAAPKQNAAPINERATATTAIRDLIMRGIPAEVSLDVNINQLEPRIARITRIIVTSDMCPVTR